MGKKIETAISYNNLGITYIEMTDYPKALEFCERAWQMANSLRDTSEMVNSGTSVANILYYMKEYEKSLKYYERILRLLSNDNKYNKASLYNNIANVYIDEENYDKAEEYFEKSLSMAESEKNLSLMTTALINIANSKIKEEKYEEAEKKLQMAEETAKEINDSISVADVNLLYAIVYKKTGCMNKALEKINNSLSVYESKGIINKLKESYGLISEIYYSVGNYATAYDYQSKYIKKWEKIKASEEKSFVEAQRMRIKAENETEIRDKEIALLEAEKENAKMMFGIAILFLSIMLISGGFIYVYIKKKRMLLEKEKIIYRKDKNTETIYDKITGELSYVLFGMSVDIAKMEDVETYNKFSATFKRLSNKYNELIELLKREQNN